MELERRVMKRKIQTLADCKDIIGQFLSGGDVILELIPPTEQMYQEALAAPPSPVGFIWAEYGNPAHECLAAFSGPLTPFLWGDFSNRNVINM
jgi:hypothetical protein